MWADREVSTRHGLTVSIRPGAESDAAALYALDVELVEDGRGQVRLASDLPDAERFAGRLFGRMQKVDAWLVAEHEGATVAHGSVNRFGPALCRHVGEFEISVAVGHQGRGIGRVLSEALLDAARTVGIERLQLFVRSDNERAIALYRSLGFEIESVRRGFLKLPDGRLLDDLSMVAWLGGDYAGS